MNLVNNFLESFKDNYVSNNFLFVKYYNGTHLLLELFAIVAVLSPGLGYILKIINYKLGLLNVLI